MPRILPAQRRTSQPQGIVGIDWGNPITRGLVGVVTPNNIREILNGVIPTLSGSHAIGYGLGGQGRVFPNESTDYEQYAGTWSRPSGSVSHLSVFSLPSAPTVSARLSGNFQTSTNGYGIIPNGTNIRYATARSGTNSIITGSAPVAGKLYVALGVTDATNNTLYENGIITAGPTAHGGWTAATGNFRLGLDSGGSGAACKSTIFLSLVWNRALTDSEAREITKNPWQIFKPEVRALYFDLPTGGAVTHDTSGALTGQGSTIAGSAARTHVHPTSGALTGQGSTVVGSAARTRVHTSTGALTGQGSEVAGSAQRIGPAVTHETSGALVGLGSIITGEASVPSLAVGGDDAFRHTGWDKKAWKKRKKLEDALENTVRQALKEISGIEPEPETVESVVEKVKEDQPNIVKTPWVDYSGVEQWVQAQQVIISRIIARQQEEDDDETLLLLL